MVAHGLMANVAAAAVVPGAAPGAPPRLLWKGRLEDGGRSSSGSSGSGGGDAA